MSIPFDQTVRGAAFFDRQLPALIKAINRLADIEEKRLEIELKNSKKGDNDGSKKF